jgi:hypothetical protein
VVRHLEHVGPQVGAAAAQRGLCPGPEVTGEQDRQAVGLGPDDEGQVVGGRRSRGDGRIGCEDLERHRPDRSTVTGHQREPVGPRALDLGREGGSPLVRGRQGARGHRADVPAGQRSRQPADVIRIEVRYEHERQ